MGKIISYDIYLNIVSEYCRQNTDLIQEPYILYNTTNYIEYENIPENNNIWRRIVGFVPNPTIPWIRTTTLLILCRTGFLK